jgi:hypothetical protein
MTDRPSNILHFEPPDSALGTQVAPEASRLLVNCRDRLVHGVATAFAGNLGRATDALLGMADHATSLDQQQLYFAAMEFLSKRGQQLLQQFRSAYVNQFDAALASLRRHRRIEQSVDLGELKLVDTDDFERDLTIGKLSARAALNCATQLTALDRRFASLLRLPRISQDENPLYPRALFAALLNAFGELKVGQQLGIVLLQEFERQTAAELPGIYADLNRHLIESGILPKIPLAEPATAERLEGRAPPAGGLAGAPVAGPTMSPTERFSLDEPVPGVRTQVPAPDGLTGDEVFAQLLRAIQQVSSGTPAPGMPGHAPPPAGYVAAPSAAPPRGYTTAAPGFVLELTQLISALTGLQRGRSEAVSVPGLGELRIDPSQGDALQQIRSTSLAEASQPVDAMTIDIVAMLFDGIFNDPDLPATLRAEIAKLQIPVLKVALIDKTFFSNKRHPARRLLDAIAGSAVGRNEADEPRLIGKIASLVDDVVVKFETDIGIFATQVDRLEEFLKDEESRAQSRTSLVVDKLQQADREELAAARAASEVRSRIHRRNVPTLVADFLDRHWRQVLVRAFVRSGDEGASWLESVGAMDDLLWSVEPKRGPEERNLLLTSLPDLLKRLRTGLESVGLVGAWDPFFAQLIRLHMGALHKEIPDQEYSSPPSVTQYTEDTGPVFGDSEVVPNRSQVNPPSRIELHIPEKPVPEPVAAAGEVPAMPKAPLDSHQSTEAPKPEPRPAAEGGRTSDATPGAKSNVGKAGGDRHLRRAQSLEVGAWVEFQSFRGTRKTLRLNWISEFRGVLLFTNRQGENALTIPAASLAEHLRKGTARVLSPERLTDRAVSRIFALTGSQTAPQAH